MHSVCKTGREYADTAGRGRGRGRGRRHGTTGRVGCRMEARSEREVWKGYQGRGVAGKED